MDPYDHNPYSPGRTDPVARPAPARQHDAIARLDVSDKWKARFRAIEKAGGPGLPQFRRLAPAERRSIQFNWLAFLLGPFYFLAKGLWRQAVVYLLIAIACVVLLEALGLGRFARAVGYGFAALYAIRANTSYYRKVVLDQAPWA